MFELGRAVRCREEGRRTMKCQQNLMERQNVTGARPRYYVTATVSMKSAPLKLGKVCS